MSDLPSAGVLTAAAAFPAAGAATGEHVARPPPRGAALATLL